MNIRDRERAKRLADAGLQAAKQSTSLEGYAEIAYAGDTWPLDAAGVSALPEEVIREATDEEKRAALLAQGYTLGEGKR